MPPPELSEDLVQEVLLRVPPDDPALLLRASLVCRSWRRLLTDPAFLRRYRALHQTPPLLGFLHRVEHNQLQFVPSTSFRPSSNHGRDNCEILDCRHGRVLFYDLSDMCSSGFRVWDPITGEEQHVPGGTYIGYLNKLYVANAAVLCAVADCDHGDCHGGPFIVILVDMVLDDEEGLWLAQGRVYSSETGKWSAVASSTMGFHSQIFIRRHPSALVGDVLYFCSQGGSVILSFDFCGEGELSMTNGPVDVGMIDCAILIPTVDGGLRLAAMRDKAGRLGLWSLETVDDDNVAAWTHVADIHLNTLPSIAASHGLPYLIGSAKDRDSDLFFVSTSVDIFAVELESRKTKKLWENMDGWGWNYLYNFLPYTSFLTPGMDVDRNEGGLVKDGEYTEDMAEAVQGKTVAGPG